MKELVLHLDPSTVIHGDDRICSQVKFYESSLLGVNTGESLLSMCAVHAEKGKQGIRMTPAQVSDLAEYLTDWLNTL